MYLLDTSIVSNYLDRRRNFPQLVEQTLSTPPEQIFISIITLEEIIQGALASIQKMRQKSSVTDAYRYAEAFIYWVSFLNPTYANTARTTRLRDRP